MDVRDAIDQGNLGDLQALLAEDAARANAVILWGDANKNACHPLHYVCDKVFDGTLGTGAEIPLVHALIDSGADVNSHNGDPLVAAASLGAVDVAFVLLDAGARPELLAPGGETALHWAAYIGAATLVDRLLRHGVPIEIKDRQWNGTPLGWALYGWSSAPVPGDRGGHREAILRLVRVGAIVNPEWLDMDQVRADDEVLAALRGDHSDRAG